MDELEVTLVALLLGIAILSAAARAINVPYPIVLVLGGALLSFAPGLQEITLDPDLVLLLFLPPLLYSGAFFANLRELRTAARPIALLAIGLVLVTMLVVAVVAHELIDGMSWAAAFTLGAIVGPTDPVAATAIARRLGVPRRLVSVLEGEALVNDATALVAYRIAITAATSVVAFSFLDAAWDFLWKAAGGIAVGLVVGWIVAQVRKRLNDPLIENTISLLTAYAAYVPAELLHVSAVLAAVTVGCYVGWMAPQISSPTTRLHGLRDVGAAAVPAQRVPVHPDRAAAPRGARRARGDLARHAARLGGGGERGRGALSPGVAVADRVPDPLARGDAAAHHPGPLALAGADRGRLGGHARRRLAGGRARAPHRLPVPRRDPLPDVRGHLRHARPAGAHALTADPHVRGARRRVRGGARGAHGAALRHAGRARAGSRSWAARTGPATTRSSACATCTSTGAGA